MFGMPRPPSQAPHLSPHRQRMALDTDPAAEAAQFRIFRRMTAAQKVRIVEQASQTARQLAMAGLRERFPQADEKELLYRYVALEHGEELARHAYPEMVAGLEQREGVKGGGKVPGEA